MTENVVPPTKLPALEAIVTLPFRLPVDVTCLGLATRDLIGCVSADIILPDLTLVDNDNFYISPPQMRSVKPETLEKELYRDHTAWGAIQSYKKDQAGEPRDIVAWISRVLVRVHVTPGEEDISTAAKRIADQLDYDVEMWSEAVGIWFEVATASYLPRSVKRGRDSKMWLSDGVTTTSLKQIMRIDGPVLAGRSPSVDVKCWRRILAAAAKESTPPDEHVLLRDSRQGIFENQTRRAVLDAATAAEISLAALLDKELESLSLPPRLEKTLSNWNNSLGKLAKTLKTTFDISLRQDIHSGLAQLRNRSIHRGFKPSQDEAKRALEIATDLVEMVNPRDELLPNPTVIDA